MRRLLVLASILALTSCAHFGERQRHPGTPQGTCQGACAHYVDCKGRPDDDAVFDSCVTECRHIFSDEQSLYAFEQLECIDAIAFVEGASGRPPDASPLADSH